MKAFVAVPFLMLASCANPAQAPKTIVGDWGGPGIGLTLEGGVGTVEYDCASGTIDEAIPPAGPFSARGTYRAGQPGPVRVGEIFKAERATYSGEVVKDLMTLTVKLEEGELLGPFELTYGAPPQINACL